MRRFIAVLMAAILLPLAACKKEEAAQTPKTPATPAVHQPATPGVTPPTTPTTPAVPPVPAGSDLAAQAQPMLDSLQKAIADKKITDAEAILKKLEEMKSKLPPGLQEQITQMSDQLKLLKSVPAVPGIPK